MKTFISLTCCHCQISFQKCKSLYDYTQKKRKQTNFFCSPKCKYDFTRPKTRIINCAKCGKEFSRKTKKESLNEFCSTSCAASLNNTTKTTKTKHFSFVAYKPRNKYPQLNCSQCRIKISPHSKTKACKSCFLKQKSEEYETLTLRQIKERRSTNAYHGYIRLLARKKLECKPKVCEKCNYSKYVECCHKKSLSSFSLDDPLSIINSLENLMWLCPNCHKEFDLKL